jgi:hypothetical protein
VGHEPSKLKFSKGDDIPSHGSLGGAEGGDEATRRDHRDAAEERKARRLPLYFLVPCYTLAEREQVWPHPNILKYPNFADRKYKLLSLDNAVHPTP